MKQRGEYLHYVFNLIVWEHENFHGWSDADELCSIIATFTGNLSTLKYPKDKWPTAWIITVTWMLPYVLQRKRYRNTETCKDSWAEQPAENFQHQMTLTCSSEIITNDGQPDYPINHDWGKHWSCMCTPSQWKPLGVFISSLHEKVKKPGIEGSPWDSSLTVSKFWNNM